MPVPTQPLSAKPQPTADSEPSGIAADDAGVTAMAERLARKTRPSETAQLAKETSRDDDA